MRIPDDWRRYLAPAAFLLAVTIAVVLVRSGLESGGSSPNGTAGEATPPGRTTTAVRSTTTTTARAAKKVYVTVKAGDTFGVIAAEAGVSIATIEQLNPTVKSTSLFIGERIRVK